MEKKADYITKLASSMGRAAGAACEQTAQFFKPAVSFLQMMKEGTDDAIYRLLKFTFKGSPKYFDELLDWMFKPDKYGVTDFSKVLGEVSQAVSESNLPGAEKVVADFNKVKDDAPLNHERMQLLTQQAIDIIGKNKDVFNQGTGIVKQFAHVMQLVNLAMLSTALAAFGKSPNRYQNQPKEIELVAFGKSANKPGEEQSSEDHPHLGV